MNRKKLLLVSTTLCVLVLAAGGIFIATWELPAPTKQVEKVIPNERFPR